MLQDQLSLRELTLFEKGDLTELKETRVEEDGGKNQYKKIKTLTKLNH